MNRYVTEGLLNDARAGKRVVFLAGTQYAPRHAFLEAMVHASDSTEARTANGREEIRFNNGSVMYRTANATLRGMVADLVYIDADADRTLREDSYRDARHLVAATNGEIIRA